MNTVTKGDLSQVGVSGKGQSRARAALISPARF